LEAVSCIADIAGIKTFFNIGIKAGAFPALLTGRTSDPITGIDGIVKAISIPAGGALWTGPVGLAFDQDVDLFRSIGL